MDEMIIEKMINEASENLAKELDLHTLAVLNAPLWMHKYHWILKRYAKYKRFEIRHDILNSCYKFFIGGKQVREVTIKWKK